jgi:hypothetical protein
MMAYNYLCAPTRVEVPSQGSIPATTNAAVPSWSTPTNALPISSNSPMGADANDTAPEFSESHMSSVTADIFDTSHVSSITADGVHNYSHCSAVTANSEHDPQLLHPDMRDLEHHVYVQDVPQGVPNRVTSLTECPLPVEVASLPELSRPANNPRGVGMARSYEFPPCVAAAVVVNSSCNSHSCDTYHPAERRLSAVNPRDTAGTLHEMGPCGPSSRIPTAFGGMGPEGEPPNESPLS